MRDALEIIGGTAVGIIAGGLLFAFVIEPILIRFSRFGPFK